MYNDADYIHEKYFSEPKERFEWRHNMALKLRDPKIVDKLIHYLYDAANCINQRGKSVYDICMGALTHENLHGLILSPDDIDLKYYLDPDSVLRNAFAEFISSKLNTYTHTMKNVHEIGSYLAFNVLHSEIINRASNPKYTSEIDIDGNIIIHDNNQFLGNLKITIPHSLIKQFFGEEDGKIKITYDAFKMDTFNYEEFKDYLVNNECYAYPPFYLYNHFSEWMHQLVKLSELIHDENKDYSKIEKTVSDIRTGQFEVEKWLDEEWQSTTYQFGSKYRSKNISSVIEFLNDTINPYRPNSHDIYAMFRTEEYYRGCNSFGRGTLHHKLILTVRSETVF